jgi:hypothetical protein
MATASGSTLFTRLYLPVLTQGAANGSHQSVTLTGNSLVALTKNHVTGIRVTVDFPSAISQMGFDESFFKFPMIEQTFDIPVGYSDSQVELYIGEVRVDLGAHY